MAKVEPNWDAIRRGPPPKIRGAALGKSPAQKMADKRERERDWLRAEGIDPTGMKAAQRRNALAPFVAENERQRRAKQAHVKRLHHAQLRQAMPPWADAEAIRAIYDEARRLTAETGIPHEVDHIEPLLRKNATGLHWHGNLRVVTRTENRRKGNRLSIISATV